MTSWRVGLIVDPDFKAAAMLAEQMPLWVISSAQNVIRAKNFWATADRSSTSYTTFEAGTSADSLSIAVGILPTIELHHPAMTAVTLFGVASSDALNKEMSAQGYIPAKKDWKHGVAFRRLPDPSDMPTLKLRADGWQSIDDAYEALFAILGSPSWHGKKIDAIKDSIVTGQINQVEVPYKFLVQETRHTTPEVKAFLSEFNDLILHFQQFGCPVSLTIED